MQNGRVFPERVAGLNKHAGVFWRGERCETIVATRIAAYPPKRRKGGALPRSPHEAGGTSHKLLRRLQRALRRRKTLAGQQRVQSRIDALLKELGRQC